ncbi:MAG: helix-turn-helix domain-containing protein [Acidobacteria bacterium]|nr:helix-turn-helix domain-containing protein [Acidobacteriota bacterium]
MRRATPVRVVYMNPALYGRTGGLRTRVIRLPDHGLSIYGVLGVAEALKCTPVRVLQLIHEQKLKAHRVGQEWIVFGPDLAVYMQTQADRVRERYRRYLESC